MFHVVVALLPGISLYCWYGGTNAVVIVVCALTSALLAEIACTRSFQDIKDGSAAITGLLIVLCLPASTPWFLVVVAVLIGILLAKHAFGGLGQNVFNPAMAGYAAVLIAYPLFVAEYDATSGATALEVLAHRGSTTIEEVSGSSAFGWFGASRHEWLNIAFLLGGAYLIVVRVIAVFLPIGVLIGMGAVAFLLDGGGSSISHGSPIFNWFAGGTMLTAFFIATDPATSPSNRRGQLIYAIGIGVLAMLIRKYASWPDGFAFAVLLMNCFVPLIDRLNTPRQIAA